MNGTAKKGQGGGEDGTMVRVVYSCIIKGEFCLEFFCGLMS